MFFSKKLGWCGCQFVFMPMKGTGATTKYTYLGPKFVDSFCGKHITGTETTILEFNRISGVTIFDAAQIDLSDLPGPY